MEFVEGSFRLPDREWQVVIFSRYPVSSPQIEPTTWASGATGVLVRFPTNVPLNKAAVERLLAEQFGVDEWIEVRGPDSMQMR